MGPLPSVRTLAARYVACPSDLDSKCHQLLSFQRLDTPLNMFLLDALLRTKNATAWTRGQDWCCWCWSRQRHLLQVHLRQVSISQAPCIRILLNTFIFQMPCYCCCWPHWEPARLQQCPIKNVLAENVKSWTVKSFFGENRGDWNHLLLSYCGE